MWERNESARWRSEWSFELLILYLTKMKPFLMWNWNTLMQGWLITSYNIKLYIYIYIYMYVCMYVWVWCGFVRFSYHKTIHRTTQCDAIHYHLWCGAVTLFCGQFWLVWVWLCGLSGLVNTLNQNPLIEKTTPWNFESVIPSE